MAQIAHQMESALWVLCPEAFISLLQAGILGEVSGKGFQLCPFRVMVFIDWSVTRQGVISHCSWSWHCTTHLVLLIF